MLFGVMIRILLYFKCISVSVTPSSILGRILLLSLQSVSICNRDGVMVLFYIIVTSSAVVIANLNDKSTYFMP